MFIFRGILKALAIVSFCITNSVTSRSVENTAANDLKSTNVTNETNTIDISVVETQAANDTCKGDLKYCNMTKEEYIQMLDEYIYPKPYEWGLIAVHSAVFVMGLVGNALVCVAVYRNNSMRSQVTYRCLVNLAVADFLVILLCLPPTVVWDVTETWFLGDTLCKILVYFQSVSVTVSVLTLTFIAMDRWYAIVYPFKSMATTNYTKTAILFIWIIALIFNCPELIYLTTVKMDYLRFDVPHLVQCQGTWSQHGALVWHIVKFVFVYSTPLLLITLAYLQIIFKLKKSEKILGQAETNKLTSAEQTQLRTRRNVARMLVVVVVVFAFCVLPVHLLSLFRYTGALDDEVNDSITLLALISHFLFYFNSAINPLIYNMSGKFRQEFRRSFCCTTALHYENSTSLTHSTKCKRSELQSLKQRTATTSFINGSKNGDI